MDPQDVLNTDEAAHFLRLSPNTLVNWRCRKQGPAYIRQGSKRSIVYLREDLVSWLRQNRLDPAQNQEVYLGV